MSDLLADVLTAAANAAADVNRGKLLHRYGGRECRLTAPDTLVMSGAGLAPLVHQIEGTDLIAVLT
jgi:hypothetical protein